MFESSTCRLKYASVLLPVPVANGKLSDGFRSCGEKYAHYMEKLDLY